MTKIERKVLLCAIYTRKSTDHNLDLEFNSLDAQREACEAYIKSQAHEGWHLISGRYDDGAFSGASLDRPALEQLLADVRAGKINTVVVYKVDRLTRSLADFAKLVELFDEYGVSFVSITQSFNTTSSMGRLTLNVLLSFAQFEREVIGERVRDKIAASKRKGIWVGGPVPLGYRCIDRKVVVVPEEAETVKTIFQLYLELGSMSALIEELDRVGVRTKTNGLANGSTRGGTRFGVGSLAHLLKNRFYIGEVVYRGETHRGEHEPILDRHLFEAVQAKRVASSVPRRVRLKGSSAILTGRIFGVDVIVTSGSAVVALKQATSTVPIVFTIATDPVGAGLVASLAHPGGNVTGLSVQATDIAGKRIELLRQVVPDLHKLALLGNVNYSSGVIEMGEVHAVARKLGLEVAPPRNPSSQRHWSGVRRTQRQCGRTVCCGRCACWREHDTHQ